MASEASEASEATEVAKAIADGHTSLGIELGSTRIKAVLTGPDHAPLAVGGYGWENKFVDRLWTYSLDDVWSGVQACYAEVAEDVRSQYGVELTTVGALGISAMMHGYLALDTEDELLVPFRTWRNTHTGESVEQLSELFEHNIPHRWSIAHLDQAILDDEAHVGQVAFLTTLSGYVHYKLTGHKVLGVGDASGMFPIDIATGDYDAAMATKFNERAAAAGVELDVHALLPTVKSAGEDSGELSEAGAKLLDPSGTLQPGITMCAPEGDAGTGMVATNSVAPRTGNVSAGTSIFAMVVLEKELSKVHRELDLVTTPAGDLVAMAHCNNGASELNSWAGLFTEFVTALGVEADPTKIFETLFKAALDGTPDGGGLMAYNYLSGEPITDLEEGRPLFLRAPDGEFSLANFMRVQLYSAFATLRLGMDVLTEEGVRLDQMFAHGGLFKTKGVAQGFLAAALDTPVSVGEVAAEGGAWGIAMLAAFNVHRTEGQSLADYLQSEVFANAPLETIEPNRADVEGFDAFIERYVAALPVEKAAVEHA